MAEACWRCGTTEAETYRYCTSRKRFVCLQCERICENHSRKLLPNGTNCKLTYNYPIRQLYGYLANSEEVRTAKEKYIKNSNVVLKSKFAELHKAHNSCDDTNTRVKLRVELAAINEILTERGA